MSDTPKNIAPISTRPEVTNANRRFVENNMAAARDFRERMAAAWNDAGITFEDMPIRPLNGGE